MTQSAQPIVDLRPATVSFAAVSGIVLGCVALLVSVAAFSISLGSLRQDGIPLEQGIASSVPLATIPAVLGAIMIWAARQTLRGESWARWTLFACDLAFIGICLAFYFLKIPLVLGAVAAVGAANLLGGDARRWFTPVVRAPGIP